MTKTVSPTVIISAVSVALLMPHVTSLYAMPSNPAHEQLLKLNRRNERNPWRRCCVGAVNHVAALRKLISRCRTLEDAHFGMSLARMATLIIFGSTPTKMALPRFPIARRLNVWPGGHASTR
jgi:hypothetical protein